MREIISYESIDGVRFDTAAECNEHEKTIYANRLRLCDIEFLDEDKKNMLQPLIGDEDYEEKMDDLFAECEYLHIRKTIPQEARDYIRHLWGWCIPYEKGLYEYDFILLKWFSVKEDE